MSTYSLMLTLSHKSIPLRTAHTCTHITGHPPLQAHTYTDTHAALTSQPSVRQCAHTALHVANHILPCDVVSFCHSLPRLLPPSQLLPTQPQAGTDFYDDCHVDDSSVQRPPRQVLGTKGPGLSLLPPPSSVLDGRLLFSPLRSLPSLSSSPSSVFLPSILHLLFLSSLCLLHLLSHLLGHRDMHTRAFPTVIGLLPHPRRVCPRIAQ